MSNNIIIKKVYLTELIKYWDSDFKCEMEHQEVRDIIYLLRGEEITEDQAYFLFDDLSTHDIVVEEVIVKDEPVSYINYYKKGA